MLVGFWEGQSRKGRESQRDSTPGTLHWFCPPSLVARSAQATTGMRGVSLPDRAEKDCVTASPVARVVPPCTVNGRLRARSAQEMALERAHTSKNTDLLP